MKDKSYSRYFFNVALLISFLLFYGWEARSQTQNDLTMLPILEKIGTYINDLEDKGNCEIVHFQADIGVAETERHLYRNLSKGWTYTITLLTDDRIRHLKVRIRNSDGEPVKLTPTNDEDEHPTSFSFACEATDVYRITIVPTEMEDEYLAGHYGIVLFHENPYIMMNAENGASK